METIGIGVVGCSGRMGRLLLSTLAATPGCEIAGGTEAPGSPAIGQDLGTLAGLEPLARLIFEQGPVDPGAEAEPFVNVEKGVASSGGSVGMS